MAKIKANDPARPGKPLGNDRLLGISDVAEIFNICESKASELMKLTGRHIVYARKVYILESNLLSFVKELEVEE